MKVAFGTDERTDLTDAVRSELESRGHEVVAVDVAPWPDVGREVGTLVANGDANTGVLFCWTGTGVSIAANKVAGIRAALCTDAETAEGARKWNDANVLVMPLGGQTRVDDVPAMLEAWFETDVDPDERENIAKLER
jgi:ribose 5-phosphate isomerase B